MQIKSLLRIRAIILNLNCPFNNLWGRSVEANRHFGIAVTWELLEKQTRWKQNKWLWLALFIWSTLHCSVKSSENTSDHGNHTLAIRTHSFPMVEIFIQYISESWIFPKGTSTQNDRVNTEITLLVPQPSWKSLYSGGTWISFIKRWAICQRQRVNLLTSSKLIGRLVEDDCSLY